MKLNRYYLTFVLFILMIIIYIGYSQNIRKPFMKDYLTFKGSNVFELVLAVTNEDTNKIKELAKKLDLNETDTAKRTTVLSWAICNNKYDAVKTLINLGADPYNEFLGYKDVDTSELFFLSPSNTPLSLAFSNRDERFAHLLAKYIRSSQINCDTTTNSHPTSYMIKAAINNFESFKLLVDKGGDINLNCRYHKSPLYWALIIGNIDFVYYLVVTKNARIDLLNRAFSSYLRLMTYKIGSEEHKKKMEIVNFIKEKYNIDYFKEPIPPNISQRYAEDYLKTY